MSDFKINSIATKQGQHGPVIAGVSTVNSTGCMKIPSGKTVNRLISEEVVTVIKSFDPSFAKYPPKLELKVDPLIVA